ncbi:VOC family protein [Pseudonocardia yunnanensis]|uniref:VOC family protein n=1 Tax=Pseudonocardia yunnanensis TaxID=58107 RepID=A0ABW4F9B6_9PSEU
MRIDRLDHIVLTVADLGKTITFYTEVLGMDLVTFGEGRQALTFGRNKINLHEADHPFSPHAESPVPGSQDFCLIVDGALDDVVDDLTRGGVAIELGPVDRTGATGTIRSVYVRDPDGNLVELSVYPE